MQVRKITRDERIELSIIQSLAFFFPIDVEAARKKAEEKPEEVEYQNCWGCFDEDGKLLCGLMNMPFGMYYDGSIVAMNGVGGVASRAESRMQGGVRAIFSQMLAEDRARGVLFSVLFPFSHPYYRKFGYDLCHEGCIVRFPTKALAKFRQRSAARMYAPQADDAALAGIYASYASRYNYAIARNAGVWKHMLSGNPLQNGPLRYILSRDGQDIAYCIYKPAQESDGTRTMQMIDFAYVDREALWDLLGFLYKLSAEFATIQMELPDDFSISMLVDEAYDVKVHGTTRSMARALDARRALEQMRHPGNAGRYTVHVDDAFLPENTGAYEISFNPDVVQARRIESDACDLSVSIQTLTQLCLGHVSLQTALLKPDVQLFSNRQTLERVFVRKPKLLTDRF